MWKVLVLWSMLMGIGVAHADSVTLKWDQVIGATMYNVYISTDLGVTWQKAGSSTLPTLPLMIDGTKLLLFRVTAVAAAGESIPDYRGAWYNGAWNQQPANVSVK